MATDRPSGTGHDTAPEGEIVDFEAICVACGHAAKFHHPMSPLRTCAATVYTDAPIGGGSCYPCRCRGFVAPDQPPVAVPGPASEPICHCGLSIAPRDPDPWEGRMDAYCTSCASNRCDCYPDTCPVKHPAPGPASVSPAEPPEAAYNEIAAERVRQDAKWGGVPGIDRRDDHTYAAVLGEEFGEVCKAWLERDVAALREELVQTAAVAVAWIAEIDNGGGAERAR